MSNHKDHKISLSHSLPYTVLGIIMLCMLLTGCELRESSKMSSNRIQVEQERFSEKISVSSLDDAALSGLANHYRRHGDGPFDLTVTYDPHAKSGGAMHASDHASKLASHLRSKGVRNVEAGVLPVKDSGDAMNALISYTAYNALAPKDCEVMPGVRDFDVNAEEDYKLGCTVDTIFAKQIARPKDLRGQVDQSSTHDGRRITNKVDVYRSGAPSEPLEGENASE